MNFKKIIKEFTKLGYSISTMESCSGGGVSNAITNCSGSSDIFCFGAVTYSNEYKLKMGVDKNIIDKYSVYSRECANSMSKAISTYTNSTYGVGITGKMNRLDKNNLYGDDSTIFISIYNSLNNSYKESVIKCLYDDRSKNKELVIDEVIKLIEEDL